MCTGAVALRWWVVRPRGRLAPDMGAALCGRKATRFPHSKQRRVVRRWGLAVSKDGGCVVVCAVADPEIVCAVQRGWLCTCHCASVGAIVGGELCGLRCVTLSRRGQLRMSLHMEKLLAYGQQYRPRESIGAKGTRREFLSTL